MREHITAPRVSLLGHSWGATLALRYALAHPDRVDRLIYVSGTGVDPDDTWHPAFRRAIERRAGADAARLARLRGLVRTAAEEREYAILQWSADFVDPAAARGNAERMATPWLGINRECASSINAEVSRYLRDHDLAARCRGLATPTLIIDGAHDPRPRWAVDSLQRALSDVRRVSLAGAGHMPWVEDPAGFRHAVTRFLAEKPRTVAGQGGRGQPDPR